MFEGHTLHVDFSPIFCSPLLALATDSFTKVVSASLAFLVANEESKNIMEVRIVDFDWNEAGVYLVSRNVRTR
jgi:hypothetical protein